MSEFQDLMREALADNPNITVEEFHDKYISPKWEERELLLDATRELLEYKRLFGAMKEEYEFAVREWEPYNSGHEGWAVIKEELDELWVEVMDNKRGDGRRKAAMKKEAIQVAVTALRFVHDLCGE